MIDGIVKDLKVVVEKAKEIASYGKNRVNFKKLKAESKKSVIDACFNQQYGIGVVGYTKSIPFPKL